MVNRQALVVSLMMLAVVCSGQSAHAMDGKTGGLNRRLVGLLYQVEHHFGRPVTIVSGCRSHSHNRRIGGARESYHLRCMAADIKVQGVSKGSVAHYANGLAGRGGVGSYCRDGSVHIDVGPRRNWVWQCNGRRVYTGLPGVPKRTRVAAR
jgi:uncharacterized protein YcbK (DUF882 family)